MNILLDAYLFFSALALALIVHEVGHYIVLRYYGRYPTIWFSKEAGVNVGTPKDYAGLTHNELLNVYASGITCGLIALYPAALFINIYFSFGLVLVYLLGSLNDIKQILRL